MFKIFNKNYNDKCDEDLMNDIVNGIEPAFNELYKRYNQKLYRYFCKLINNNTAQAEDFLQELFLKIINHPQKFDANKKFSTWIYAMATNMCKNEWRNNANRTRILDGFENWNEPTNKNINDSIEEKFFAESFENVLNNFKEIDRELILLRYQQELPIKEIAEILKIPEGTVKSRLFNLLRKLAVQLKHFSPINN